MLMGLVGPEGGGKTVTMTYFALKHACKGGIIRAFPGYEVTDGNNHILTEQLSTEQWVNLGPEIKNVLVCIDEIQNFFNSIKHMATLNYLFTNLMAQRRHRNLGVIYTVQDWGWLDSRIRWLTHVLGVCSDAHWSNWGREEHLPRGEIINVVFYDVKGFYTGHPWTPSAPFNLRAKHIWPCYDSFCDVDIWSGMSKVEFKRPIHTINVRERQGLELAEESMNPPAAEAYIPGEPDEKDQILLQEIGAAGEVTPALLGRLSRRLKRG